MNTAHLAQLDLNLLVVLHELLRTGSTTEAAQRLGRTQSAISHALGRLRDSLGDPLFVRAGSKLRPTPRAAELADALRHTLAGAEAVFEGRAARFEPSRWEGSVVIAGTDFSDLLVLPRLVPRLRTLAPGLDVRTRSLEGDVDRYLAAGEVDLAYGREFRDFAGTLRAPVFDDHLVLVVRRGHPVFDARRAQQPRRPTLDAFCAAEHALATPRGLPGSAVDTALAAVRRSRRVVLRAQHFSSVVHTIARTDLVSCLPASLALVLSRRFPLRVLPLPAGIDVVPMRFELVYSAARRSDPALAWLREEIVAATRAELEGEADKPPQRRSAR